MKGDLISREALKEAGSALGVLTTNEFYALIDNAPTVDAIPNAEGYEMYNKGYVQGYERGKAEARPQGKWVFDSEFTEFGNPYGTYKCDKCGGHSSNKYPFCFWCGADMRGGDGS